MGHTMSIHSQNDAVILEFGLHKPAYRICVNTPTTHGSIGLTTGLDPAMTLGCGGFGGNITSDNITPRHLLNIKRLAYGLQDVAAATGAPPVPGGDTRSAPAVNSAPTPAPVPGLPRAPSKPIPDAVSAEALSARIDQFLASLGVAKPGGAAPTTSSSAPMATAATPPARPATPVEFVCEDDVRLARREGRT